MIQEADVVVVGGGPAGTSTALHLVRAGVPPARIVLLDKARFPREKPCAGAISQHGVDALESIGIPISVPKVRMRGVRVLADGGVGETYVAMGIVVRRSEFDAHLLDIVRREGVLVREDEGLQALERVDGGWRVETPKGAITTRLVAACDGAGSAVRKRLGVKEAARKGHLYVLETDATHADVGVQRGLVDFDLSVREAGLEGYYWDFPTLIDGRRQVSRGIYHANFSPRSDVKSVLGRWLAMRGVDIENVTLKPYSTRPFVRGSVLSLESLVLVGEAAGIDQCTGEGIAQALVMGGIAARHLADALSSPGRGVGAYGAAVNGSVIGRHMLQSEWLAKLAYGRHGGPARRYLLRSTFARDAAMRWYRGESLGWSVKLRLGLGLGLASATASRRGGRRPGA